MKKIFIPCLTTVSLLLTSQAFSFQNSLIFQEISPRHHPQTTISPEVRTSPLPPSSTDFETNPFFQKKEKKLLRPFLLPSNHPIKAILDNIFIKERATLNVETFAAAGFVTKYSPPRSHIKVASHPLTPGYLFKVYLDSELRIKNGVVGWKWFERRIKGANKIRKYIKKAKVKHFVVPQKWIYAFPVNPSPPDDPLYVRKNELLVVEDMNLVSEEENLIAWQTKFTKEHLKELYSIISYAGGNSYRADNIVYTKEGKFAFIDTEYPHKRPNYRTVMGFLSPEMCDYWTKLVSGRKNP